MMEVNIESKILAIEHFCAQFSIGSKMKGR